MTFIAQALLDATIGTAVDLVDLDEPIGALRLVFQVSLSTRSRRG